MMLSLERTSIRVRMLRLPQPVLRVGQQGRKRARFPDVAVPLKLGPDLDGALAPEVPEDDLCKVYRL